MALTCWDEDAAGGVRRCRVRRAVWCGVALALMAVGGGIGDLAAPAPAGSCSMAAWSVDFAGTVLGIEGPRVTYRVDRVWADEPVTPDQRLVAGAAAVVDYHRPTELLVVGEQYRVRGYRGMSEEIGSQIAYDFRGDCGTGAGTTALDGSYLGKDTSLRRWWPWGLGFAFGGGGAVVGHRIVARRRLRSTAA